MNSENKQLNSRQLKLWRISAAAVPLMILSAKTDWLQTGLCVVAAMVLQSGRNGTEPYESTAWEKGLRWVICAGALGMSMRWLEQFWRFQGERKWIPVILLLLAAVSAVQNREESAWCALVLLGSMGVLLGSTLAAALPEIRLRNLMPDPETWGHGLEILTVLLLMVGGNDRGEEKQRKTAALRGAGAVSLMTAICIQGMLSGEVRGELESPLYTLSGSIRLFDRCKRFESLMILGIILGGWLWLSFLLTEYIGKSSKQTRKIEVWSAAALGTCIYLWGMIPEWLVLVLTVVAEYLLPAFGSKRRKTEENS